MKEFATVFECIDGPFSTRWPTTSTPPITVWLRVRSGLMSDAALLEVL
jgi:hypothetical protein